MSDSFKSKLNRRTALGTLTAFAAGLALVGCGSNDAEGAAVAPANIDGPPEKPNLKLGFIKLTDMAPLA
ncbi:MAG: hypothetical protein WA957_16565, partial [Alteraurantiacibacter sp.]